MWLTCVPRGSIRYVSREETGGSSFFQSIIELGIFTIESIRRFVGVPNATQIPEGQDSALFQSLVHREVFQKLFDVALNRQHELAHLVIKQRGRSVPPVSRRVEFPNAA
jgi:hypothetical protein